MVLVLLFYFLCILWFNDSYFVFDKFFRIYGNFFIIFVNVVECVFWKILDDFRYVVGE